MRKIFLAAALIAFSVLAPEGAFAQAKPRTIITTDGEIDDVDSFIRMLLYANEFSIEGLVYSSSMWHYRGDGKGTGFVSEMELTKKLYGRQTSLRWAGTRWMDTLLDAYAQVYPLLKTHAPGYPTADRLKQMVKVGNIDFEGEMDKDSEGSNYIKSILLDERTTPIYLQVWGGTNTIARALKSIEEEYRATPAWKKVYGRICAKTILYAILDQDATYKKYISVQWPGIKVFYNAHQFWCLAYPWKKAVDRSLHYLLEGSFMGPQVLHNHGPLTHLYYSYGDGQRQEGDSEHTHGDPSKISNTQWGSFHPYDFISEGDSPAFLHLVNTGLGNLQHPDWGGWGGRLKPSATNPQRWEDGERTADFNPLSGKMDLAWPQVRWLKALQHDFAARANWCVQDYGHANHPPVVQLTPLQQKLHAGGTVLLRATATDPDNNPVTLRFWQYQEAGNSTLQLSVSATGGKAVVQIPAIARKGNQFHIIVEATDQGQPALTRYGRFVLTVE